MRFKAAATTFATAILTATPAAAWGDEGHKVIALIAYGFLTSQAKSRVETLLQADDDALTPKDFASRATWADKFRDGPGPQTAKWHYVNLEIRHPDLRTACFGNPALRGDASRGPAQDCVIDKITEFEHELSAPGYDPAEQVLALKYLLHFVGDVHQPLHASDDHDAGGNCELVSYAGGLLFGIGRATVKLHAYWDTAVVHKQGEDPRALAVKLTSKISAKQLSDWQAGSPRDWAWDSYNVARQVSYNLGRRPSCNQVQLQAPIALSAEYEAAAQRAAALQLEKAGVRLATVLNRSLGPPASNLQRRDASAPSPRKDGQPRARAKSPG